MRTRERSVTVTRCWGGQEPYFLVGYNSIGNGFISACRIRRDVWDRKAASEALDVLESVYGLTRSQVRFRHI